MIKKITILSVTLMVVAVFSYPACAEAFSLFQSKTTKNNCAILRGGATSAYGGDAVVWFEYGQKSSNKPSATSQKKVTSLSGNFSEMVINIKPDTTYYYRMVVETPSGRSYGNDVSFSVGSGAVSYYYEKYSCENTSGVSVVSVGNLSSSGIVYSNTSTGNLTVGDTGAILSAVFYPMPNAQTIGWFEWGRTPDLGNRTQQKNLGTASSIVMSETINGLTPGTVYFYKTVTQSSYGVQSGVLYSFRTTGINPSSVGTVQKNESDYSFESENTPSQISTDEKTNTKPIAKSEKSAEEKDSSVENKSGTSTFGAVAAAAAADGNPFFSLGTWVIFIGNILFLCAIYFLYVFFSDKKDDIGYVGNGEEVKNSALMAEFAKAPVEKREATPKGAPPTNLPV